MEETREQPIIMPATALNAADEKSAMSEVGSQDMNMGKFKSVQALMDAYNNLQAEFTKKCQKLSQLQKDKTNSALSDLDLQEIADFENNLTKNDVKQLKNEEKTDYIEENGEIIEKNEKEKEKAISINSTEKVEFQSAEGLNKDASVENAGQQQLDKFLESNFDAKLYEEEIKKRFPACKEKCSDPYQVAWAEVLLSSLKEGDKLSDPLINQYVLSDERVKNKIIEDYLKALNASKPPIIMSSQSGERLSGVSPDRPKTLADAKVMMDKMFS